MKKNNIINDELSKISDREAEIKKQNIYGSIGCLGFMILDSIIIWTFLISNPVIAIAAEAVVAYMVLPMYYLNQESKEKLNNAKKEKKHLLKIMNGQIPSNENYNIKRLERIKELEEETEVLKNKEEKNGKFTILPLILMFLGVFAATNTPLALMLAFTGLSTAISSYNKGFEITKEKLSLKTRIANLKRDLMLGPIFGYDPSKQSIKVNNKSNDKSAEKSLKNSYSQEQINYANEYVEMLSNASEDREYKVKEK